MIRSSDFADRELQIDRDLTAIAQAVIEGRVPEIFPSHSRWYWRRPDVRRPGDDLRWVKARAA